MSGGSNGTSSNGHRREPGEGGLLPSSPGGLANVQQDAKVITRAINQRWPITPEMRAKIIERLDGALDAAGKHPRAVATVTRMVMAAEAQNQADEHMASKNDRLDAGLPTERVALSDEDQEIAARVAARFDAD